MEHRIVITHFENPHRFWYRLFSSSINNQQERLFAAEIDKYCREHYLKDADAHEASYRPVPGEIVAVYDSSQDRWTRNRVLLSSNVNSGDCPRTYRLWSIDEGVPRLTKENNVKPLPEKLGNHAVNTVKRAAMKDILPAVQLYDASEQQLRKYPTTEWDKCINIAVKSLIESANQIYFENVSSHIVNGENANIGDLRFVTEQNTNIGATQILNLGPVMFVENSMFLSHFTAIDAATKACIPAQGANMDMNESVGNSKPHKKNQDIASPVHATTVKALQDSVPDTKANKTGYILARLKRTAGQRKAGQASIPPNEDKEATIANSTTAQTIKPKNILLDPKSGLALARKSCRDPAIGTELMNSSINLERYTVDGNIPKDTPPSKLLNFLKNKVVRIQRNQLKSETSLSPDTTATLSKEVNEEPRSPAPPVCLDDNAPEEIVGGTLPRPQEGPAKLSDKGNSPLLNVQRNSEIKRFEKAIKEEQCVLSSLRHHRILVHGRTIPKPIESITNTHFCATVHQELERLRMKTVYRLQAYTWPHIMRGNSLVCVNTAATGKTFAFLPAVCSFAKIQIEESLVASNAGPVGIILCRSSREVLRVAHLCRKMLNTDANKHLAVVDCYGVRKVTQTCNLLFSGCALLVTTAPTYRRLYENMPEAFVRSRIQMVVIDNIEEMLRHFTADVLLLCKNCDKPELQMIVTASFWHATLASFLRKYKNMLVCIGAYLEAAVYARVQFMLRLRRNDGSKQYEMARYVKQHDYRSQRTIVFASTRDDLQPIVETLRQHSIHHLVCSEATIVEQLDGFRSWDDRLPGDMTVLVCLDEMLGDLDVSKAQHIVHFSLPSSWSAFTKRFATSFGYYDCPYLPMENGEKPKERSTTLVLLDENNNHQLPKLIDFLELHNVQFPEELSKLAQNIRTVSEYTKIIDGMPLSAICPQLLGLSVCRQYRSCIYRHALTVQDLPQAGQPTSGTVRLHILHVFSPVHFGARLEAHRISPSSSWMTLTDPKQFLLHDIAMQAYFANTDRHQLYGEVLRNELCAFQHEHNYWRCRIIHCEGDSGSRDVLLRFIDTGRIVNAKSANLLCLPNQFQTMPGQAIDVRIAGVVPHDFEEDWDKQSTINVQQWIIRHLQHSNHHVHGNVLLALRDTIWVDDLLLVEQLDLLKTAIVSVKLKSSIASKQFGVTDGESFEKISHLIQQCEANRVVMADEPEERDGSNDSTDPTAVVIEPEDTTPIHDPNQFENDGSITDQDQNNVPVPTNPEELCENDAATVADTTTHAAEKPTKPNVSSSSSTSFEMVSLAQNSERYRFETFEKGNQYNVGIGRYYAPDNFYVYEVDKLRIIQQTIQAYVTDASNVRPLTDIRVGGYCFVYYDSIYQRGLITETRTTGAIVFFLDVGGTLDCNLDELFEFPAHLQQDELPFVAVWATLAYIEPMTGSSWTEEVGNAMYDNVLAKYNTMIAVVVRAAPPLKNADTPVEGCHRYELLLTDGDFMNPYSIVSEFVQLKLAMFVGDETIYGTGDSGDKGDDDDDDDDASFLQMNFTHEEVQAMLAGISKGSSANRTEKTMPDRAIAPPPPSSTLSTSSSSIVELTVDEQKQAPVMRRRSTRKHKSSQRETTETPTVRRAKPSPVCPSLPRLECDYRFPQIVWRQDDFFVTLRVAAPDVCRYDLAVNVQSLLLQFIHDDHRYLLPLNLFGPIEPEHTTHEIRGLTIVIRLVSRAPSTLRWPTLLNHTGKLTWIKKAIVPQTNDDGSDRSVLTENEGNMRRAFDHEIDTGSSSSDDHDTSGDLDIEGNIGEDYFFPQR